MCCEQRVLDRSATVLKRRPRSKDGEVLHLNLMRLCMYVASTSSVFMAPLGYSYWTRVCLCLYVLGVGECNTIAANMAHD